MEHITPVDLSRFVLSIQNDHSVLLEGIDFDGVSLNETSLGDPKSLAGMTVGLATLEASPPHNGERHNGGDEIIIVISGKLTIESDSNPNQLFAMQAGDACVIRKGEWHKISVVEKAQLIYITPASDNEHRF